MLAFSMRDQKALNVFLLEIAENGYCTMDQYYKVYKLLCKRRSKKQIITLIKKNRIVSNGDEDADAIIELLNLVKMMFAMKVFFSIERNSLIESELKNTMQTEETR